MKPNFFILPEFLYSYFFILYVLSKLILKVLIKLALKLLKEL